MNNKQLTVIVAVIIVIACVIAGALYFSSNQLLKPEYKNITIANATFEVPNTNGTLNDTNNANYVEGGNYKSKEIFVGYVKVPAIGEKYL